MSDYTDLTDCPTCRQLATDRDDALRDADAAHDEAEVLREVLRRHVMDWGHCGHPDDCACSHAVAWRLLGFGT